MCQPSALYAASRAMQLIEPWMQPRLPKVVDPTARAHIIQLTAGVFERQSALISGEPFLAYLERLGWEYVFRASADSQVETSRGWKKLRALSLQARRGHFL